MLRAEVEEGRVAVETVTAEKEELASRLNAVGDQKQTLENQNQVMHIQPHDAFSTHLDL